MARQPRFVLPDFPMHIVQRGNDRMACFRADEDYLVYLALLRALMIGSGQLHAYCLMTNHVHLLVTPRNTEACSSLMRSLAHRYAQYFNKKYARTGSLWEGRYRACLVESDSHVLACHRYIELNPVRAGMVGEAAGYSWSSYHVNSEGSVDPMVRIHPVVQAVGPDSYRKLVADGLPRETLTEIRTSTQGGYPFASDAFKQHWSATLKRSLNRLPPGPFRQQEEERGSVPGTDLFSGGGAS